MDNKKENLYSRQIGTLGSDTMLKLSNLKVAVYTLDNIGLELCKCLCLLGIKKLYIYDPREISKKTLGTNYIINSVPSSPSPIQIDTYCANYLKELNNYVEIKIMPVLDKYNVKHHSIIKECDSVIVTKLVPYINPIELDKLCSINNTKFIMGLCYGFSGYIFSNFNKHTLTDIDGESLKKTHITKIDYIDNETILYSHDKSLFNNGDSIKFTKLEKKFKLSKCLNDKLYISGNLQHLGLEGIANLEIIEVKEIQQKSYKSLEQILADSSSAGSSSAYNPNVVINISDHTKIMKLLADFYNGIKSFKKIDMETFKSIVSYEHAFPVISCIIGSTIAQEIVKITGKYIPLDQELILDYSELSRPNDTKTLYKTLPNDNYKAIYKLLSKRIIKYLKDANIFLVGSGALGCEYLKLFHMLNISSNKEGRITVTDMDTIELSNLNRQFLFRTEDIGKMKSSVAAEKMRSFNKDIKICCLDKQVGEETEDYFNTKFWKKQDIIINALDNVKARQYIDSKCVLYKKPLFETGTLGVKANVQVIIPYQTCSYSDIVDPPEKEIPVCTLKNFPFKIEHCIQWSLDIFNTYFNEFIVDIKEYSLGKSNFKTYLNKIDNENIKNSRLNNLYNLLLALKNNTIVMYITNVFNNLFIEPVKQLIKDHPKNKINDDGTLFWSGIRLFPKLLDISKDQNYLIEFINNFGILLYRCLGKSDYVFNKEELKSTSLNTSNNTNNEDLIEALFTIKLDIGKPLEIDLEKDDDTNNHINYIKIISNIRGYIYGIEEADFMTCKLIAGKITPALSTTTTLVTALSMMEVLKYVYNTLNNNTIYRKLDYNDSYINMGLNFCIQSTPTKPIEISNGGYSSLYGTTIKTVPDSFTTWDSINLSRRHLGIVNITDLLDYIKDKYEIDVNMISTNNIILYSKYSNNKNFNISEIYTKLNKKYSELIEIEVSSLDETGIPVVIPRIIYSLTD